MITVGSCFSGIGGIDLALESLGFEVIWQCDSDPCARAVLAAHWPGVRCYEDVRDIDAGAARVSLICGGFPCAPHSVAGKRKGTSDARWLWPEFARVIGALRPELVFIENVPGLRSSGLRDVLADLASLGFDAEWGLFSAAEVGAPHIRRRLFVLAYANGGLLREQPGRGSRAGGKGAPLTERDGGEGHVAYAHGEGQLQQSGPLEEIRRWARNGGSEAVAHADGARLEVSGEQPARQERAAAERGGTEDNPWAVEPRLGRVAYGVPARVDRLRLIGNACVPQTAAHAFRSLAARAL